MNKQAVLFGLNYTNTENELAGCINDVIDVSEYLINYGFSQENIKILTDISNPNDVTSKGICNNLIQIVEDSWSKNLDFVWIHYSGHGSYLQCLEGDELDGRDECIVPLDYETNGFITDDLIYELLYKFNPKTRVVMFFDCCHSGTICDLKYHYVKEHIRQIENNKPICPAKILCISGCDDTQTSADTTGLLVVNRSAGAMTAITLDILKKFPETKYNIFLLKEFITQKLKKKGFTQVPQITSSYDLDEDPILIP